MGWGVGTAEVHHTMMISLILLWPLNLFRPEFCTEGKDVRSSTHRLMKGTVAECTFSRLKPEGRRGQENAGKHGTTGR